MIFNFFEVKYEVDCYYRYFVFVDFVGFELFFFLCLYMSQYFSIVCMFEILFSFFFVYFFEN